MTKKLLALVFASGLFVMGGLPAVAQDSNKADEAFAALDANTDGKLSQAEFETLFEMQGVQNASAQDKQNEFKAWDADSDGSISKAEFSAKYAPPRSQPKQ
jgi:Ca2+-binding EF-hand superfamily protein